MAIPPMAAAPPEPIIIPPAPINPPAPIVVPPSPVIPPEPVVIPPAPIPPELTIVVPPCPDILVPPLPVVPPVPPPTPPAEPPVPELLLLDVHPIESAAAPTERATASSETSRIVFTITIPPKARRALRALRQKSVRVKSRWTRLRFDSPNAPCNWRLDCKAQLKVS
jgi:hypothetical protein